MLNFYRPLLLIPFASLLVTTLAGQSSGQSAVLDSPITESTAISFFWIGDLDSHFRDPMNFYAVSHTDRRFHTVSVDHQWNAFISSSEMQGLIDGLKALHLDWVDSSGREEFVDYRKRNNDGFLDITVVASKSTSKARIRIARMCDQLARLDSAMSSPRILWQFQLFRVDNGCEVPGYNNSVVPPE
jgi:hypothetical protein